MLTVKLDDGRIVGQYIIETLKSWGYYVDSGVQSAADFFTPQDRKRAIILAHKSLSTDTFFDNPTSRKLEI